MSLAANALLTVEEAKTFFGIDIGLTDMEQAQYENYINAASQEIENYCLRKFITPESDITEIFDGDGTGEYYVENIPIVGTIVAADVSYRSGIGETWTATSGTLAYETKTGRVYFTDGNVFGKGKNNWRIQYSYGYTVANVPADLKMAAIELAAIKKKQFDDKVYGVSAITYPEHTVSYAFDKISESVKATLNKYKRIP